VRTEYGYDSWDAVAMDATTTGDAMLRARTFIAAHQLNAKIRAEPDLGRGKQIGHSFLFGLDDTADIVNTWRFEILPLLEEYFFGQYSRIQDTLFNGDGSELFDWEHQQIRSFDETALEEALKPFVEAFDPDDPGVN